MERYYDNFRRNFGPEVLRSLDGEALLNRMHAHGNRDSLVYWLEFKDDDEFPAIFGSIAGGSALKFGIYKRSETGAWATRGVGSNPRDISTGEAIEIARRHRDQLLAAVDIVAGLNGSDDSHYMELQALIRQVAPDVEDTAWGHKYLALMCPDKIEAIHVSAYQRYGPVRTLQLPPTSDGKFAEGRYVCGGRYVAVSRALDLPLIVAYQLLNRQYGQPRGYWRVGTSDRATRRNYWPMMRDGDMVAVGWPRVGDLSTYSRDIPSRDKLRTLLQREYPNAPQATGRAAAQLLKFATEMREGDRVIASDGMTVLGIGEISGPYRFTPGAEFPHQRAVTWRSLVEWQIVDAESLQTAVGKIQDYRNQVAIERHLLDDAPSVADRASLAVRERTADAATQLNSPHVSGHRIDPLTRLTGVAGRLQSILERKGQAVLNGPPGTGKTYWALRTVRDLAALRAYGMSFDDLTEPQRSRIVHGTETEPFLVRTCSFHPEYGYEDFIEGFRPRTNPSGQLAFELVPGVFRRLCRDAESAPDLDFYLVIDEINRGDVPRIFGELLTLLERDKRGQTLQLPVSGDRFSVPANVFVVGTMNTADRSIALLDIALRRRFGFVELMPSYTVLGNTVIDGLPLAAWLMDLNQRICAIGGGDARNRQIGHAFFLDRGVPINSIDQFAAVLRDDIAPLLGEYCYDDFAQLAKLLGPRLVDINARQINGQLFEPGRGADLIGALMRPEIATAAASTESVEAEEVNDVLSEAEDDVTDVDPIASGRVDR